MPTRVVSIRMPEEMAQRAEAVAGQSGMTLSEFLIHAADQALGGKGDPAGPFLGKVREWVVTTYAKGFPEDVTRQVFLHIRKSKALFDAYQVCIASAGESGAYEMRTSLHRRIGLMVKRVLNATVIGRSLPLDPQTDLITSCALLRPGPAAASGT